MIRKKSRWFAAGCVALLLIGSSYAYWSGMIQHTNELKADEMEAKIIETFTQGSAPQGTVQKEVSFQNNSSSSAFLRISYAESWEIRQNGKEFFLNNQVDGTDVAVKNWKNGFLTDDSLWQDGNDGWFYYKKILPPGEKTDEILESVTFPKYSGKYKEYKDADYQLYFRIELLQVSDSQSTLNSDEVNRKASETVFGKKAVVDQELNVSWQ